MRIHGRAALLVLVGGLVLLGACDSDDDTESVDTAEVDEDADADEGTGDDDESTDAEDEAESEDEAEDDDGDISVDLPDPCELLQSDPDALAQVAGEVSGFDGPEDSEETFNGETYGERTCIANGERFDVQLELSPSAVVYAPEFFNDEEPVEDVGDGAYLLRDDEGKILDLVFKAGEVGGSIFLNFPGGELTGAEDPTEEDFGAIGTLVTSAIADPG